MGEKTMSSKPFDFLNDSVGKEVLVQLKGNIQVRGTLKAWDPHMNIVLEDAQQLENSEVKTKFGRVILRGDNIILLSP
jgi:small nuclear ribonucleoprotein